MMICLNGQKGMWTFDEVLVLVRESNIPFKIVLDGDSKWNHRIEEMVEEKLVLQSSDVVMG